MKQTYLLSAAAAAVALFSPLLHAHEVYGGIGTEGVGAGFAYAFDDRFNGRAEVNGFALSRNISAGDLSYDARATLLHGGLYADWFPAPQSVPFRFVIGALIGDDHVNATANSTNGTYNINGVVVAANGQTVTARVRYPTVRPYLGIGFGHTPNGKPGFGMYFDAGVTYGRPRVSLNVPDSIAAQVGQANIDAERQDLQDRANRLRFYPIVKIGVTYRF